MIGITISGRAYTAIAATLPALFAVEPEIAPDGENRVWLPRIVVERLRARRGQARPLFGDGAPIGDMSFTTVARSCGQKAEQRIERTATGARR
jgi:hypothetical protein